MKHLEPPTKGGQAKYYWEQLNEGKLVFQHCQDCKSAIFYPRVICPECGSDNLVWQKSKGRGKIYSYTVVNMAPSSILKEDLPYVVALVDLDEEFRVMTNIIGCEPEEVEIDMPVEVVFEKISDETTLPLFQRKGGRRS